MKKLLCSIFIATSLLLSCSSSEEDTNNNQGGFATTPVSGVVYSNPFTMVGGKARSLTSNGVEVFYIYLTETAINCNETENLGPLWIIVPAAVGTYDFAGGARIQFQDPNSTDFEGASDAEIEITAISTTTITGKLKGSGFNAGENEINGTFSVQVCP
ncbi:hypothetical protein [Flavobacterium sp.]|uniref:hypothetical protein n=1 Tax=Flavobacterium sp. TaxID=239 RepID=UPI00262116B1|nr:hypothetical protein [Flavobacterium sp.]